MTMLPAAALSFDDVSNVACNDCGVYDASLRYSEHPSVTSFVAGMHESTRVGILCARCRGMASVKATAVSLFLGWWSLRGPKATISAIAANVNADEQHPSTNARLLRALARREFDTGNPEFAAMFAAAAHAVQPQRENSRLMDDLKRAGHRATAPRSPWRFAAIAPIVIFAVVVLFAGARLFTAITRKTEPTPTAAAPQAAPVAQAAEEKVPARSAKEREALLHMSADELEKQLTPNDRAAAARYLRARLKEWKEDVPALIRRGDPLLSMQMGVAALKNHKVVGSIVAEMPLKSAVDTLGSTLDEAARYYHGGASVDAIERTAGESLNVTYHIELAALVADIHGDAQRSDKLYDQVDNRLDSVDKMKQDLHVRGALIGILSNALQHCIDSVPQSY